ncbi:ferric uptake regulator family protein [Lyngbya aestuarii BL J]|uniref:Ferric uptake regulator family protein n=1 Tax=Lyngbya aestuarii BL J TaxID=1348334 RepID=U7QHW6_9CYAN|nr:Fur family transcriptional regulator [Lyngbya aestuarii]ERT07559.1 ferric uptake regulator family protein [Lyngbya aestuarii BL J]
MNIRRTRSQEVILGQLKTQKQAISAQELYAELRKTPHKMGLATVYRALDALKREGLVQVRTLPTGESVYSCVQQDEHHLTCVECGKSIPLNECPVHHLESLLQQSHHFKIYYHTLEFFGLCEHCCHLQEMGNS